MHYSQIKKPLNISVKRLIVKWASLDSNQGLTDYESGTLTN